MVRPSRTEPRPGNAVQLPKMAAQVSFGFGMNYKSIKNGRRATAVCEFW